MPHCQELFLWVSLKGISIYPSNLKSFLVPGAQFIRVYSVISLPYKVYNDPPNKVHLLIKVSVARRGSKVSGSRITTCTVLNYAFDILHSKIEMLKL